jgi:hypothetical protein
MVVIRKGDSISHKSSTRGGDFAVFSFNSAPTMSVGNIESGRRGRMRTAKSVFPGQEEFVGSQPKGG